MCDGDIVAWQGAGWQGEIVGRVAWMCGELANDRALNDNDCAVMANGMMIGFAEGSATEKSQKKIKKIAKRC
ncbi:MAG: hypothetical protein IJE07_11230 [Clostridia bacterium]|nr:hypothetical protein [Clostridia bacterium]